MSYYANGAVVPEFAKLIVALASAWDAKISEQRIRSYAIELSDISWKQLQDACAACRRECQFFPSIKEIRSKVVAQPDDLALIAWASLDRAARKVGAWSSVIVDDGAAAEAIVTVFGSWPQFVEYDDGPALAMKRQEFFAAYRQAVRHRHTTQRRMIGLCEMQGGGELQGTIGRIHLDGRIDVEPQRAIGAGHERRQIAAGEAGIVENDQAP